MNILIVSDSHGDTELLYSIVSKHRGKCDLVIHLGDNLPDLDEVMRDFPTVAQLGVLGNCDFAFSRLNAKYEGEFTAEGCRIFYTHGHKYNVNYGLEYIVSNAKMKNCNIVLFGHTHVGLCEEKDGVLIINPGSISRPRDGSCGSFALLTVDGENRRCQIVEVE